ncbi:MAG: DUF3418 domain-containing protein [Verrucomicrobiales bacterium]
MLHRSTRRCSKKWHRTFCRYRYTNPHWLPEMGGVYGEESVLAFGLPLVEKRRVHFGRIDPKVARDIFILEALVNGETRSPLPALAQNRETMRAAERLEHKLRRLGGMVHPEAVISFYQEVVPRDICTQKAFEKWASQQPAGSLDLTLEDCIVPQVEPIDVADFPDAVTAPDGETRYPVTYLHNPASDADGITVKVPLGDLPHIPAWFGDWLVAGWLKEKTALLFRVLNKDMRTLLPSNREVVDDFLDLWQRRIPDRPLVDAALEYMQLEHGIRTSADAFDLKRMPAHMMMRYEIIDDSGKSVGSGRDLAALQKRLAAHVEARFSVLTGKVPVERQRITDWLIGDLAHSVPLDKHTIGFPGLHDCSDGTVALRLWPDEECARSQHRLGVARLYRLVEGTRIAQLEIILFSPPSSNNRAAPAPARTVAPKSKPKGSGGSDGFGSLANAFGGSIPSSPPPTNRPAPAPEATRTTPKAVHAELPKLTQSQLFLLGSIGRAPRRNRDDLITLIVMAALGEPRTRSAWDSARASASEQLFDIAGRCCASLGRILELAESVANQLDQCDAHYDESIADAREHFDQLLAPGWILNGRLADRITDFQGLELRLTRMKGSPAAKDLAKLDRYRDAAAAIWSERTDCACKQCHPPKQHRELLERDFDARLKEFAQELRGRARR